MNELGTQSIYLLEVQQQKSIKFTMRHIYKTEQWLPYSVDVVFAFFANPENLPRLMPPWQKARIEQASLIPPPCHAPCSGHIIGNIAAGAGTRLTIGFRPFPYSPVRLSWEAEIADFSWNDHFCDRQLRGPFTYWHHCHSVRSESRTSYSGPLREGTLLRDEVEYEVPLGKLGEVANSLVLAMQLRHTFDFRHARTSKLMSGSPSDTQT